MYDLKQKDNYNNSNDSKIKAEHIIGRSYYKDHMDNIMSTKNSYVPQDQLL